VVKGLRDRFELVDQLLGHVSILEEKSAEHSGHGLSGKSVVFTGTLHRMDRREAQKQVHSRGGKTPSNVTRELDYLVVGDEKDGADSSKLKAARKLMAQGSALRILTEDEFHALLAGQQ
jgi:NAD-dependent DNA ligase